MKLSHRLLILTLILVLSVISMAAAPNAAAKYPYAGLWKGNAADGGSNELRITYVRKAYMVEYVDKVSAECGGGRAKGKGWGQVVGGGLVTGFPLKCVSTGAVVNSSYNVGMALSGTGMAAWDSAGTSYNKIKGVGCNGR